jgi:hypothetical protein
VPAQIKTFRRPAFAGKYSVAIGAGCAEGYGGRQDGDASARWSRARGLAMLAMTARFAWAVSATECEDQRAFYPKDWNDTSDQTLILECKVSQAPPVFVKIGKPDAQGRTPMSVVPDGMDEKSKSDDSEAKVYRIWLDAEQAKRVRAGKYFATVLRDEKACFIRGHVENGGMVFFIDGANPRSDSDDKGSFYNKAPRFGVMGSDMIECKARK